MISELQLWVDTTERDGYENMAIDEWLLSQVELPTLRIYHWQPGWGSFGYFVPDTEAAESLGELNRVRRWTGGGIVDHSSDWTYTLVFPGRDGLAGMRGGGCYCVIHNALANALRASGHDSQLSGETAPARGGECFTKPVEHDIVDRTGKKLAGAGQRRTSHGLLHQGSLALRPDNNFSASFAEQLAEMVTCVDLSPPHDVIQKIAQRRYRCRDWMLRR